MRVTGVRCSPGMAGQGSRVEERPRVSWYISMQGGMGGGGGAVSFVNPLPVEEKLTGNQ